MHWFDQMVTAGCGGAHGAGHPPRRARGRRGGGSGLAAVDLGCLHLRQQQDEVARGLPGMPRLYHWRQGHPQRPDGRLWPSRRVRQGQLRKEEEEADEAPRRRPGECGQGDGLPGRGAAKVVPGGQWVQGDAMPPDRAAADRRSRFRETLGKGIATGTTKCGAAMCCFRQRRLRLPVRRRTHLLRRRHRLSCSANADGASSEPQNERSLLLAVAGDRGRWARTSEPLLVSWETAAAICCRVSPSPAAGAVSFVSIRPPASPDKLREARMFDDPREKALRDAVSPFGGFLLPTAKTRA